MIRVMLADDHGVIRDGLGRLISALDDIELVATAADGEQAVARARETRPDVVLMDLEMPVMDGIEATRLIRAELPETAVLILTSFSDRARIVGALDAGACGYLLKDVDAEAVGEGLRSAARGESPLDPRAARTMLDAQSEPDPLRVAVPARARDARAARRRPAEQADRAPHADQREDGQGAPHERLSRDRRDGPHAGRALGAPDARHRRGTPAP